VSQAASDLNLTFVVDGDQADRLVQRLHVLLFGELDAEEGLVGPSWKALFGAADDRPDPWWVGRRTDLLALADPATPLYVYDQATITARARSLLALASVDRVLYAMKANPHPGVLALLGSLGVGFECVSPGELARVFEAVGATVVGLHAHAGSGIRTVGHWSEDALDASLGQAREALDGRRLWPGDVQPLQPAGARGRGAAG
jgi:hypothetical protein